MTVNVPSRGGTVCIWSRGAQAGRRRSEPRRRDQGQECQLLQPAVTYLVAAWAAARLPPPTLRRHPPPPLPADAALAVLVEGHVPQQQRHEQPQRFCHLQALAVGPHPAVRTPWSLHSHPSRPICWDLEKRFISLAFYTLKNNCIGLVASLMER